LRWQQQSIPGTRSKPERAIFFQLETILTPRSYSVYPRLEDSEAKPSKATEIRLGNLEKSIRLYHQLHFAKPQKKLAEQTTALR
jgi:hypothetical protein